VSERAHWLAGRLAVVTGASRGIGAATAEAIGAAGAHVVLAARDEEALDVAARRIRDAGGEATTAVTDVSSVEDVERLFVVAEMVGPPAALVCAAGASSGSGLGRTVRKFETSCRRFDQPGHGEL